MLKNGIAFFFVPLSGSLVQEGIVMIFVEIRIKFGIGKVIE